MNVEALVTDGFYYLASPYSHPIESIREQRAFQVNDFSGRLLSRGIHVYSPIWATHRACINHDLPKDHLFWLAFNKAFIDPSIGVIVCDISGWEQSKGCTQEIEYANLCGKKVWLLNANMDVKELGD